MQVSYFQHFRQNELMEIFKDKNSTTSKNARPGKRLTKLLRHILKNYDRKIRPFYGGWCWCNIILGYNPEISFLKPVQDTDEKVENEFVIRRFHCKIITR